MGTSSVWARRVAPVAVFAAVLGGVVLVSATGGGGTRRPKPLPIQAAAGGRGEDSANGASAPRDAYYWTESRIPDSLMSGLPGEGPSYEVRGGTARIEALARALGLSGEVRRVDGGWTVGTGERVLQVMEYPGYPWYLGADKGMGRGGVGVGVAEGGGSGGSGSGGSVSVGSGVAVADSAPPPPDAPPVAPYPSPVRPSDTPADAPTAKPAPCPTPEPGTEVACAEPGAEPVPVPIPTMPPQPSDADARAAMDRILAAVGRTDVTVTYVPGYLGKEVTAAPVVGGLATVGWETRATVESDGAVAYASGFLSEATFDTRYPLLDPREALKRVGFAHDLPAGAEPAIAPVPSPSPVVREAKAVRLGLMFMPSWEPKGPAYLVPAWLVTFEGSTWEEPYLALPDRFVATPPPPTGDPDEPVCDPSPCPTKDVAPPPDAGTSGGGAPGSTGAPE